MADGKGEGMVVVEVVMNEDCLYCRGRAVCTLTLVQMLSPRQRQDSNQFVRQVTGMRPDNGRGLDGPLSRRIYWRFGMYNGRW